MKQIIISISFVALVVLVFLYLNKPVPSDDIIIDGMPNEEVMIIDEEDIPKELIHEIPDNFANVEMTTYRSAENNYEITYPKEWRGILAPKGVANKSRLESYEIYPIDIPYGPSPIFDIDIYNQTFEEFTKDESKAMEYKKILLNSLEGYSLKSHLGNYDVTHYIFELNNGKLIYILYSPNEAYQVSEEEAMWVLSTLKVYNK